jgi:hypothetical protein
MLQEIEKNYHKDLDNLRELMRDLDAAENYCQTFLETLYSDVDVSATVTKEQV